MPQPERACPVCGQIIPRRPGDSPYNYRTRRTCSRLYGQRYRRSQEGRREAVPPSEPHAEDAEPRPSIV
ncbi:MAG: hypothetical protein WBA46_08345, partial [Thermomicrobiales bacterium]